MWKTERRITLWLFSLALIASIAHLIWAASTTDDGWKYVGYSVSDAAYDWIPNQATTPTKSDPDELADFWLKEIDRITAENPDSAEVAMGCALFLHASTGLEMPFFSMQYGSRKFFDSDNDFTKIMENMHKKKTRFELLTRDRRLKLTKRATELEPDNKDWWRLRAMLLFSDPTGSEFQTHTLVWENDLKEAASHDPDNALYDYLAANYFWVNSLGFERIEGTENSRASFQDRKSVERGLYYFRSGVKKKFFTVANYNSVDIESILKMTSVEEINYSLMSSSVSDSIFFHIWSDFDYLAFGCVNLAEYYKSHAEPKKALQFWRDYLLFQNQKRFQNGQDIPLMNSFASYNTAQKILELENQFPGILDENEKKSWQDKLPALKLETLVHKQAMDQMPSDISSPGDIHRIMPYWFAYVVASPSIILATYGIALCLIFGTIAFVCNGFSLSSKTPFEFGITRHLGIWFSVFAFSMLFTQKVLELSQSQQPQKIFIVHPILWILSLAMGGVALVRSSATTDGYLRNHPRRTTYSLLWFFLLLISMAVLWFAISFCREFLVTSFHRQPGFFLAGWMFTILLFATWNKLIVRKSKNVELKENENRLGTAFATLAPTALLLTLVFRLPFFLGYEWRDPQLKGLLGVEGSLNWFYSDLGDFSAMNEWTSEMNEGFGMIAGWSIMHGTIIFLFFVAILVGLSVFWQRKRDIESSETTPEGKQQHPLWSTMSRKMACSSLALGLIGLFLWTLAMPFSMQLTEKFEAMMTSGVDYPYEFKKKQFKEIDEIKANDELMKQLKKQAKIGVAEDIEKRKEQTATEKKKKIMIPSKEKTP